MSGMNISVLFCRVSDLHLCLAPANYTVLLPEASPTLPLSHASLTVQDILSVPLLTNKGTACYAAELCVSAFACVF